MARNNLDIWVPEEQGSTVLSTIATTSAVEALATREPMSSDTKTVGVVNGIGVSVIAKGAAYPEDQTYDAEHILQARKFGTAIRMAEEDLADSAVNVIANKQSEWAKAFAIELDNACLATTATANGTTVPFNSVYYQLSIGVPSQSYSGGANIIKTATTVAPTYQNLSDTLAKVEQGAFNGDLVVIASPYFKSVFRSIKDTAGNPIFVQGLAGTPDTLFGYEVVWSRGARTSSTATANPTGNHLLIVANKQHLLLGVRSGPESFLIDGSTGASALTDEAILKMRARRAFQLGNNNAAAILEIVP